MKYAGIVYNDFATAEGIGLTFFTQGCDRKCKGCFNPETWDFDGGKEFTPQILMRILDSLSANGIQRHFNI